MNRMNLLGSEERQSNSRCVVNAPVYQYSPWAESYERQSRNLKQDKDRRAINHKQRIIGGPRMELTSSLKDLE